MRLSILQQGKCSALCTCANNLWLTQGLYVLMLAAEGKIGEPEVWQEVMAEQKEQYCLASAFAHDAQDAE